MMDLDKSRVKILSGDILKACIINDDIKKIEIYLDNHLSWMRIDNNNLCLNKSEVLYYLTSHKKEYLDIRIMSEHYEVKKINNTLFSVFIICNYSYMQIEEQLFLTFIWSRQDEDWRLVHAYSSSISREEELQALNFKRQFYSHDISKSIHNAATIDPLTRIHNNQGFEDEMTFILKSHPERKFAIIKFGVRNFRFINYKLGYQIGDKVLKDLATNLLKSLRRYETCGRIEKDNFAMLYQFKDRDKLNQRIEIVRKKLINKNLLKLVNMEIHLVAGIYIIQENEQVYVKDMLDKAFMALQSISRIQSGSRFVYYEDWMLKKQYQNSKLLEEASKAIENDEFELYIQPQFDMQNKKIVAGEALTRWIKDGINVSNPDEFIPIFEEHGIIINFDLYVLEKLCCLLRKWIDKGTLISPISINQSRQHLNSDNYFQEFCAVVDKYKIPHQYIAFELTESVFVENSDKVIKLARELHNRGFQLAIDDFGTGYAFMNLLSVISADILKIDKSLLFQNEDNIRSQIIVEKIIEMAHRMDMLVVCERVETQRQLEFLIEIHCDIGQGYYLGKPIKAIEFAEKWLIKEGSEVFK